MWIALDDAPASSGGLHYSLGSHRLGDLEHSIASTAPFSKVRAAHTHLSRTVRAAVAYAKILGTKVSSSSHHAETH